MRLLFITAVILLVNISHAQKIDGLILNYNHSWGYEKDYWNEDHYRKVAPQNRLVDIINENKVQQSFFDFSIKNKNGIESKIRVNFKKDNSQLLYFILDVGGSLGSIKDGNISFYETIELDTFSNFDYAELSTYYNAHITRGYYGVNISTKIISDEKKKFSFSIGLGLIYSSTFNSNLTTNESSNLQLYSKIIVEGVEQELTSNLFLNDYNYSVEEIENSTFLDLYIPFTVQYKLSKTQNFLKKIDLFCSLNGGREWSFSESIGSISSSKKSIKLGLIYRI